MTPIDRFERQLPAALSDLAEPRTPDYFLDILGQTARTRQRPAWVSIERWFPVDSPTMWSTRGVSARLAILGVVIALAIVIGAVALSGGGPRPAPVPVASAAALAPSTVASPAAIRFPDALKGSWTGTLREVPGLGQGPASALRFVSTGFDLAGLEVDREAPFGSQMSSRTVTTGPDSFSVESTRSSATCSNGAIGHYTWSVTDDTLKLVLVDDACDARATILPGAWVRSIADDGPGGAGYATLFRPFFTAVLPAGEWDGRGSATGPDELVTDTRDGITTFKVWKDLDGFADPCDIRKGRLDLAPGIDPFIAYIAGDARFSDLQREELTIDGHRAVALRFRVGKDIGAPCWTFDGDTNDRTGVLLWVPHAVTDGYWNTPIDSEEAVVVTEIDGATLVFEAGHDEDGTFVTDRATLDSIRFIDDLPASPPG